MSDKTEQTVLNAKIKNFVLDLHKQGASDDDIYSKAHDEFGGGSEKTLIVAATLAYEYNKDSKAFIDLENSNSKMVAINDGKYSFTISIEKLLGFLYSPQSA